MTGWEGLLESGCHVLHLHDGLHFQEGSEDDHVVGLGISQFGCLVGGIYLVDGDVGTGGVVGDAVGVIDEQSARFYAGLELVEGLLVEDDGGVELAQDGGADLLVAEDYAHVAGTAAHFTSWSCMIPE